VRSLIKNINDPQSVPVLHSLGITHIVVHGISEAEAEKIPYVKIIYRGDHSPSGRMPESPAVTKDSAFVLEINQNAPYQSHPLQVIKGTPKNGLIERSAVAWEYEVLSGTIFTTKDIEVAMKGRQASNPKEICFNVRTSLPKGGANLLMESSGETINLGHIDGSYRNIKVPLTQENEELKLRATSGENFRITKIGCS
jgi:hypothetical protein